MSAKSDAKAPAALNIDPYFLDRGHDIKLWPRRLLHVPTLTSIEREGENTYAGTSKPEYNILSYTWGRFTAPSGPALHVRNITWQVPTIEPSTFTVTDFARIIQQISTDVEFVWVDIACIDQSNYTIKMDEIGRQAGIFNNAKRAFIWLHRTFSTDLQQLCDRMFALMVRLDGEEIQELDFTGNPDELVTVNWCKDDCDSDIAVGEKDFLPHCLTDANWLSEVKEVLESLTSDVWFTSLWTLQEAFLRPDALLLPREGTIIRRKGFSEVVLLNILVSMGEMDRYLIKALAKNGVSLNESSIKIISALRELRDTIEKMGLGAWDNPNILYHSTKHRQATDPLDRIYGIMQIYGFRLGASADPSKEYTLDDLENQLAIEINSTSPIMGQLFVHQKPVDLGKCWRIHQDSYLPQALRFVNLTPASISSICPNSSGQVAFRGLTCSFAELSGHWTQASEDWRSELFWGVHDAVHYIILDSTSFSAQYVPEGLRQITDEKFAKNEVLSRLLIGVTHEELEVLMLGNLNNPDAELEDESWQYNGLIGLLVRAVDLKGQKGWQRIGLCIWSAVSAPLHNDSAFWSHRECLLG